MLENTLKTLRVGVRAEGSLTVNLMGAVMPRHAQRDCSNLSNRWKLLQMNDRHLNQIELMVSLPRCLLRCAETVFSWSRHHLSVEKVLRWGKWLVAWHGRQNHKIKAVLAKTYSIVFNFHCLSFGWLAYDSFPHTNLANFVPARW